MEKKYLRDVGVILFITIIAILVVCFYKRKLELNHIEQVEVQNNHVYYVDRGNDEKFRIIRSDLEGKQGACITIPRHVNQGYRTIYQLFFDDQGEVYILMEETDGKSYGRISCGVYRCDFEEKKIVEMPYDFREIMDASIQLCIQDIRDGEVYYFSVSSEKQKHNEVQLCVMDKKHNVRVVDHFSIASPYLKTEYFLSDNNTILWMEHTGEVFARKVGSDEYINIEGISGLQGRFKSLCDNGKDMAYILDYVNKCIREINLSNYESSVICAEEDLQEHEPDFSFASLMNMDCMEEGFCTQSDGAGHSGQICVYFYQTGEHEHIHEITLTFFQSVYHMKYLALGILLLGIFVGVHRYFAEKVKVRTILMRVLLVFVAGLVLIDVVLGSWLESSVYDQSVYSQQTSMYLLSQQLAKQIVSSIEAQKDRVFSEDEEPFFAGRVDGEKKLSALYTSSTYTYAIIRADQQGTVRIERSASEYTNVPVEWCYTEESCEAIYRVYESRQAESLSDEDKNGQRDNRIIPLILSDGSMYGVLMVSTSGNLQDYQLWYYQRNLRAMSVLIILVITIIMLVIMIFFLQPLKKLKEAAGRIADGEMGVTVPVRGRDEVTDISRAFNQMSEGIARYVKDIKEMSEGYYKFVPESLLGILGKKSIQEVQLGDHVIANMAVLSMHIVGFPKYRGRLEKEDLYATINKVMSVFVKPVAEHKGIVENIEEAGISALFTESCDHALDAALQIHKDLDRVGVKEERTIVINYGEVMVGVVGHEERLRTSVISVQSEFAKEMRLKGEKYGARTLITHMVYLQIPEFEQKYHVRYLGNVYVSASDSLERIYDVYDGDSEETFYYKELTRPLFEKGVELFVAKKFYDARLVFVEVLKLYRRDKAAKEYLYRCDKYYKCKNTEEIDAVLERF